MRWARLLHAHERVEVLAIDAQARKARILRHGFEQDVSLKELVFEEEESSPLPITTSTTPDSIEGATLNLHLSAGQPEVTLHLRRDGFTPAYLGLYLQAGRGSLWVPLWQAVFNAGTSQLTKLSQTDHTPPWTFRLYVLPLVNEPSHLPPEVHIYEAALRPLFFARSGTFPVVWMPLSKARTPQNVSNPNMGETASGAPPSTYDFPRAAEIDLHIEKLAPHLASAPGDVIFQYQREVLVRYLDWAYQEKLLSVRVIHGKGSSRLRQSLLDLCDQSGWKAEVLMTPPYSGGATKVSF